MLQDALTPTQQSAIRKLIRAKSDREIARLLRQSHRLRTLHRRRRSCISHRERWTDYELRLLGQMLQLLRGKEGAVKMSAHRNERPWDLVRGTRGAGY